MNGHSTGADEGVAHAGRGWRVPHIAARARRAVSGDSLRARAVRGSGWTLIGFGLNQVLRLASSLILTRLLFPEAFGIMALANVFMTGLQMFSDIGIRPSIIQNKRGDDVDFLNTAWTMQIIRGFALWLISCVIAYPVSELYGQPVLFPVLCVIGSTAMMRGFQTTGYATANRKLMLGRLTLVELGTHAIGLAVMIVWARLHPSVWALAGGAVVSSVLSVCIGYRVLSRHPHRLRWDPGAASALFSFGKWIFLSSALTFLAGSGDKLLMPKILSIRELAFYTIALSLISIPSAVLNQIASRVLFPVYAEVLNGGRPERIRRVTSSFIMLSWPIFMVPLVVLFCGDWLVRSMYDSRYESAGPAISVLAVGGYLNMMRASQNGLLLAAGQSKLAMLASASRIATGLPLATLLAVGWGLEGFCAGMVVSDAAALAIQRTMSRRVVRDLPIRFDITLLSVLFVAVAVRGVCLTVLGW
jgi:O-antigen/teichoic acid export membrane protein